MCFTLMPASFLWRSGRQLFQILDIVLEWKGWDSRQPAKKPIMPFKKAYLFLLRSNSLKKQLLVSPTVNFHQTQTECTLRLPTDSHSIKGGKKRRKNRQENERGKRVDPVEWSLRAAKLARSQNVDFGKDNSEVLLIHTVVTTIRLIYSGLLFFSI